MTDGAVNSVGEMLRAAREARGQTIEQVNMATKISVNVLQSLEQDDFESFQSDIYLKGFLRSYAKYLGVEIHDVLRTLDKQRGGARSTSGVATWDDEESIKEEKLTSPRIFRRFVLPVLVLIIVVLLFLFINERRKVRRLTTGSTQGYVVTERLPS